MAAASSWPPPPRQGPLASPPPTTDVRQAHLSPPPAADRSPSSPRPQQQQQQHPPLPPALQHLAAHDLVTGAGAYGSLQPVLRQTFAALLDAAAAAHQQVEALAARVARQEARRREDGEASAVALRTVRALLDGHVEGLRAEFAPRLKAVEARCAALGEEVQRAGGQQRQQREGQGEGSGALARRVEALQGEVVRLGRALEGKADGVEVEAALRLRVSKASLPKRLEALLLNGGGEEKRESLFAGMRRRVEAVEGRQGEQERAVRRLGKEVAAVRAHVVGEEEKEGLTGVLRGLQAVLEQQGKRVQRAEREVGALKEKVVRELALVGGRVEQRVLATGKEGDRAMAPVVEESLKAFEQEIVKELDARDGELRRQLEGTLGLVREVEARAQQDWVAVSARLTRVEKAGGLDTQQRIERVERQVQQVMSSTTATTVAAAAAAQAPVMGGGGGSGGGPLLPRPPSRGGAGVSPLDTAAAMQQAAVAGGRRGLQEPLTSDPTRSHHYGATALLHHQHQQQHLAAAFPPLAVPATGGFPSLSHSQSQQPLPQELMGASLPCPSTLRPAVATGGVGGLEAIPHPVPHPTMTTMVGISTPTARAQQPTAGAAASPSSFNIQQQQQLESLRREKHLLRSRIQQGLMTLSQQSSPQPPEQQQQLHVSRAAAGGGGGRDVGGGLAGASGSASSMV